MPELIDVWTWRLPETHVWPVLFAWIGLYALGRWLGADR